MGTATTGPWTFSVQVDEVALFANRYYFDDILFVERDLVVDGTPNVFAERFDAYAVPEKVRAQLAADWGTATLGDAYVAFGRGLALNLNRNVDNDVDTSLQGGKLLLTPGAWDLTFVAGQANRQQVFQDYPNTGIRGDLRHLVAGARVERFGLGPANLGVHAVVYDFVEEPGWGASLEGLGGPDATIGGATAELVGLAGMDFYVEGDLFAFGPAQPSPLGEDASDLGWGVYASGAGYPGPFVVLVEGKRYFQAERVNAVLAPELYEVAVPPTLEYERAILEDSTATLNSADIWGGRVQVDWAAVPGELSPFVALAVFRDVDTTGLHFNDVPETVVHPLLGAEWVSDLALLANAGYRVDDRDGTDAGADRLAHGDLSLNFPLPADLVGYVSAAGLRFWWGTNGALQQAPFSQAESAYSLTWASKVTAVFSLDYTTNPLVESTGNVSEAVYAGAELQLKPTSDLLIKLFYGEQKAGIRCAGGQCRKLPGFDGAQLSLAGTF